MSCAATQSRKDEGKKDSGVADTKPEQQEQEIKRTAPLPINIPTASFSKPLSSHVSASPASSPLRSLSLLPAKASSLSPSSSGAAHRSLGSWRHVDGRANAKSAVAARSVCLLHSPLTSSGSIKADGGASQSQSVRWSQDVRQLLTDMGSLPFIPLDAVLSATAVDDHKSGGCSVQTLQSPMLAAKRGESRTSISLSQATSPEARKVLLSANQEKAEEAKAAGKSGLYKTELCRNWVAYGRCSYGNKCRFAHGEHDIKDRVRSETYNTKPCTDLARDGSRTCTYGKRCNYAHPGQSIRRVSTGIKLTALAANSNHQVAAVELPDGGYMDAQYIAWTRLKYPTHKHPFGMFM